MYSGPNNWHALAAVGTQPQRMSAAAGRAVAVLVSLPTATAPPLPLGCGIQRSLCSRSGQAKATTEATTKDPEEITSDSVIGAFHCDRQDVPRNTDDKRWTLPAPTPDTHRSIQLSRRVRQRPKRQTSGTAYGLPISGAVLKAKKRGFVTPTETNVHGDALCFMIKPWAKPQRQYRTMFGGWRRLAVGGWRLLALGGCPSGLS